MERRLCVADYEKDKTQQRAKRSIDMMIHAKCALFSSNYKLIARAASRSKNNAGGLMSSMTQALIHLSFLQLLNILDSEIYKKKKINTQRGLRTNTKGSACLQEKAWEL